MKRIIVTVLAVLLVFSLCGCKKNTSAAKGRTIVDTAGDTVEIPEKVNSVINLVTYGSQVMVGLGLGDYLTGINEDTVESAWISEMYPRINEISRYDQEESAESLLKAGADVVLVQEAEQARDLRNKGITAVTIGYFTIAEMEHSIEMLGEILGDTAKEKCDRYLDYLHHNITLVSSSLEGKLDTKETLYYINGVSNKGLYKTAGKGSTNWEVAELSYVDFATAALIESPANKVDAEAILAVNPENIIIGGVYQHVLYNELLSSPEWENNSAVRNGNIYKVPMGISAWNRYGIEIAIMIPWTAAMVYPELFDYDVVAETISFYKTFTGYTLSAEKAGYILNGLTPTGEMEIAT